MAQTVTKRMKRARKAEFHRKRAVLTKRYVAIHTGRVGTHRRQDGQAAHQPGRSWLGPTGHANICPGRCGAPVARDMDRCARHRKTPR